MATALSAKPKSLMMRRMSATARTTELSFDEPAGTASSSLLLPASEPR
jgi:hypothetical protein